MKWLPGGLRNMNMDLSGRVALVPGGSGGLRRHGGEVLAECGADVVLGYHFNAKRAEEIVTRAKRLGRRARADRIDATDYDSVSRWIESNVAEFGKIDILATCVGWMEGGFSLFKDQIPDQWRRMMAQQFWAQIYLAHGVLPHMISRQSGRIITIASDGAKGGQSGVAIACAGLAGVIGCSKPL